MTPAQLHGDFAALADSYRSVGRKLAGGAQLTFSDIEPATQPGTAVAVRQVSGYVAAHCGHA